jgi:predicted KAP-like P-loop ATPase
VCEYGGLVTVWADITNSQRLILTNVHTNRDLTCRVARLVRTERGQMVVGLEFLRHSSRFWDSPKTASKQPET